MAPRARAGAARGRRAGDALFKHVDSWLVWNLTGGPRGGVHVTDVTNARGRCSWTSSAARGTRTCSISSVYARCCPRFARRRAPRVRHGSGRRGAGPHAGCRRPAGGARGQCCFRPGGARTRTDGLVPPDAHRPVAGAVTDRALSTVAYQLGTAGVPVRSRLHRHYRRGGGGCGQPGAHRELQRARRWRPRWRTRERVPVPAFSGLYAPNTGTWMRGASSRPDATPGRTSYRRPSRQSATRPASAGDGGRFQIRLRELRWMAGGGERPPDADADILGTRVVRFALRDDNSAPRTPRAAAGLERPRSAGPAGVDRTFEPAWDEPRQAAGYQGWRRAVERAKGWMVAPSPQPPSRGRARGAGGRTRVTHAPGPHAIRWGPDAQTQRSGVPHYQDELPETATKRCGCPSYRRLGRWRRRRSALGSASYRGGSRGGQAL